MRRLFTALLVAIAILLAGAAFSAFWLQQTLLSPQRSETAARHLVESPTVTNLIVDQADQATLAALPKQAIDLVGKDRIRSTISDAVHDPTVTDALVQVVARAHRGLVTGSTTGPVTIDVGPVIQAVNEKLSQQLSQKPSPAQQLSPAQQAQLAQLQKLSPAQQAQLSPAQREQLRQLQQLQQLSQAPSSAGQQLHIKPVSVTLPTAFTSPVSQARTVVNMAVTWCAGLALLFAAAAFGVTRNRPGLLQQLGWWLISLTAVQLLLTWVLPTKIMPHFGQWGVLAGQVATDLNGGLLTALAVMFLAGVAGVVGGRVWAASTRG